MKAAEALARAGLLAKVRASAAELDYVNALSVRYTTASEPDFDELATRYRDDMRAVVKKYPADGMPAPSSQRPSWTCIRGAYGMRRAVQKWGLRSSLRP